MTPFSDSDLKRLKTMVLNCEAFYGMNTDVLPIRLSNLLTRLEAAELENEILKEIFFGLEKEEYPTALKIRIAETARRLRFMLESEQNRELVYSQYRAWRKASGKE